MRLQYMYGVSFIWFLHWDIKLNWLVMYFTGQWIIHRKAWIAVNLTTCNHQLNCCFHGLWLRVWIAVALDLLDWVFAKFSTCGSRTLAGTSTWCASEMQYSQRVYNKGLVWLAEGCRYWVSLKFGWIKSPKEYLCSASSQCLQK